MLKHPVVSKSPYISHFLLSNDFGAKIQTSLESFYTADFLFKSVIHVKKEQKHFFLKNLTLFLSWFNVLLVQFMMEQTVKKVNKQALKKSVLLV